MYCMYISSRCEAQIRIRPRPDVPDVYSWIDPEMGTRSLNGPEDGVCDVIAKPFQVQGCKFFSYRGFLEQITSACLEL
eukprot:452101-Amorphochlora_amoeboformis.AAC.3